MSRKFYTHDEASVIVDLFDRVLVEKGICIPSNDDDRDPDDNLGLYGMVYDSLLDAVEDRVYQMAMKLRAQCEPVEIVPYQFSGTV